MTNIEHLFFIHPTWHLRLLVKNSVGEALRDDGGSMTLPERLLRRRSREISRQPVDWEDVEWCG
jgi:hypothetical protein